MTSSLLQLVDNEAEEQAIVMSDLRHLNLGPNGDCDYSKFKTFYKMIDKVVKMAGSGAQERRHAIGEDVERTTQVVYSSEFDSVEQVRN